jgi:hypothetical protein
VGEFNLSETRTNLKRGKPERIANLPIYSFTIWNLLGRPFYEENFLLRRIGIFSVFRFMWQFFVKDRRHRRSDAGVIGVFQ